jgi:hypothetical protein
MNGTEVDSEMIRAAERQGVLGWVINVFDEELKKAYNNGTMTPDTEEFVLKLLKRIKWAKDQESDELSNWFDKKYT